jgi:hypothetical protein
MSTKVTVENGFQYLPRLSAEFSGHKIYMGNILSTWYWLAAGKLTRSFVIKWQNFDAVFHD